MKFGAIHTQTQMQAIITIIVTIAIAMITKLKNLNNLCIYVLIGMENI